MYENNNTVSIDWKGLFIKIIIVALIVFAIFKGYEYFSNNKKGILSTNSETSQLFNANLETLKQAGENYFDYSNYPSEGQTVMVYLSELLTNGDIEKLTDEKGNACDGVASYVSVKNDGGQYKLTASLVCGETSDYKVDTIGCECEENECTQAIEKVEEKYSSKDKETTSKKENTKNSTKTEATKKTTTSAKKVNNAETERKEPTSKKRTPLTTTETTTKNRITKNTTTKNTTTKNTTTEKKYTVIFDSNGGEKVATQYVKKYDTAYEPNEPEKENARFVGWYYNGRLWDFDTEITKNITLEAYYWEVKTVNKTVYTAAYDAYGTSYVTVTHKLAIPQELQQANIKNVRIKRISNQRTMQPYTYDLYYHGLYHRSTFDGYKYSDADYTTSGKTIDTGTVGTLYNIRIGKTYSYTYDRWITWSAYVNNQCPKTFDGYNCNYGIVYTVVWEYEELTD